MHEDRDSRVCDVCAKYFKCAKSYEMHYLVEHTNISQQVQCDICSRWLKHSDSLKEHKRRHLATEATCPQCGHVSPSMKALRGHIRSAHSEARFICSVCGRAFKRAKVLQVWDRIHHLNKLVFIWIFLLFFRNTWQYTLDEPICIRVHFV